MPLLDLLSKAVALFRGAKPTSVVLVEPPVAFGDVVVGTHLHPGDKHRAHEALQVVARHQAA